MGGERNQRLLFAWLPKMWITLAFASSFSNIFLLQIPLGEHQMELLDYVAAKFHEEAGIFKLLV
jgi:hypothetical protein